MEKTIYDLKLHESLTPNFGTCIMRVPGGWIYDMWDFENDKPKIGTYVPYSEDCKLKVQSEIEIDKYNTLRKIVDQLSMSDYECEGGVLKNNVAFIALQRMAE